MPRLTSLSGAQVAVLFDDPLGIVEFDEVADGVPQLRDVAVDATMDDLFLQRAIEPLGDAVGLGLGDEGVGRLDAVNGGAKLVHPGGAKLVHLMLCGTRCWGVVPVVHRRDPRCFV